MNGFDIVLGIVLLYALYKGFRQGVIVQLTGLVGIVAGVYMSYKFANQVSVWFDLSPALGKVVAFVCIFIAVIILLAVVGRLIKGLFKLTGLGALDQIFGAVLSVLKFALVLGALLCAFDALNENAKLVSNEYIAKSYLYEPIESVSEFIFPYIDFIKENLPEF